MASSTVSPHGVMDERGTASSPWCVLGAATSQQLRAVPWVLQAGRRKLLHSLGSVLEPLTSD